MGKTKSGWTHKKRRFVDEFIRLGNATEAYVQAGFSKNRNTARANGSRMLQEPMIKAEVEARQEALREQAKLEHDQIIQALKQLAFYDTRKLFRADGSPKPITELDEETARALAGLDIMEEFEGTGENRVFVGYVKKYKLTDRIAALDKLVKMAGLYKPEEQKHTGEIRVIVDEYKDEP